MANDPYFTLPTHTNVLTFSHSISLTTVSTTCACIGDLYIEIDVANDPYFKREKNDIYTEVHVGMAQAALGCTVDVVRY